MEMNEIMQKNEIVKSMTSMEIVPLPVNNEIEVSTYNKLPISRVSALGTGLEPMVSMVQKVVNGGKATSGLYKVTIPSGTHLAQFKGSTDYLGTALSNGNNSIANQAHLSPIMCDPTMLFVAATLANIDKKLDAIQETQKEMLGFIVQKEKSALKGDLEFLTDVFNNYKYNWNDDKYKTANHIKVLDIRQESAKRIDFYREQIKKHLAKKALFHSDADVKKQLMQVQDEFRDYQLSLYLYGFAYYLEVLLQENFDEGYLSAIADKIDSLSLQYRELYSTAYTMLEDRTKTSLQAKMMKGLSVANKATGNVIAKIPVISKSQLDENLIKTGERLTTFENKREKDTMQKLVEQQSGCVRNFVEQINTINELYNNPLTLIFSKETIYLASER